MKRAIVTICTVLLFTGLSYSQSVCRGSATIFGKVTRDGLSFEHALISVRERTLVGHLVAQTRTSVDGWYELRVPTCKPIIVIVASTMSTKYEEQYPNPTLELISRERVRVDLLGTVTGWRY